MRRSITSAAAMDAGNHRRHETRRRERNQPRRNWKGHGRGSRRTTNQSRSGRQIAQSSSCTDRTGRRRSRPARMAGRSRWIREIRADRNRQVSRGVAPGRCHIARRRPAVHCRSDLAGRCVGARVFRRLARSCGRVSVSPTRLPSSSPPRSLALPPIRSEQPAATGAARRRTPH
jgi:hypothetical protein